MAERLTDILEREAQPTCPGAMRRRDLQLHRTTMMEYLEVKARDGDWRGVAAAAMDLSEIDAELKGLDYVR